MGVGMTLKRILRDKKMTIKQLAESSGISVNTLYSITRRDSERVDGVILQAIAAALDVPVDYLLGKEKAQYSNVQVTVQTADGEISVDGPEFISLLGELTSEELNDVKKFAEFVLSRRKQQEAPSEGAGG